MAASADARPAKVSHMTNVMEALSAQHIQEKAPGTTMGSIWKSLEIFKFSTQIGADFNMPVKKNRSNADRIRCGCYFLKA